MFIEFCDWDHLFEISVMWEMVLRIKEKILHELSLHKEDLEV
jgi:hypothetical protein